MFYDDFINTIHSDELNDIFNPEYYYLLEYSDPYILFYLYPLIERLFIEIVDLSFFINIEHEYQGKIRTINSLLNDSDITKIFDKELINMLKNIFNENGLRNKFMHYDPLNSNIKFKDQDIIEAKILVISLANYYDEIIKEINNYKFKNIAKINISSIN